MVIVCRLRTFRRAHNISLRTLAAGTGLPKSVLSRLETGNNTHVDFALFNRLVVYFRGQGIACEVGDLLVYEPDASPSDADQGVGDG